MLYGGNELCFNLEGYENEDIKLLFIYMYELSFRNCFKLKKYDINKLIDEELDKIRLNLKITEIDRDIEWILYHFIILKEFSEINELIYITETINQIFSIFNSLDITVLKSYLNFLNEGINSITGDMLLTRPKEIYRVLSEEIINSSPSLSLFFKFNNILNVFKKIEESKFVDGILETEKSSLSLGICNFLNKYDIISEMYITFIITHLNAIVSTEDDIDSKREKVALMEIETKDFLSQFTKLEVEKQKELSDLLITHILAP